MSGRISGVLLLLTACTTIAFEWSGQPVFVLASGVCVGGFLLISAPLVGWQPRGFLLAGVVLALAAYVTRTDWQELVFAAIRAGSFIGAFFFSLSWLRNAAATSPAIERCGVFLSEQPPGRRYVALSLGGHLFGLVLSYGAISLLGGLATGSAAREADPGIKEIRTRRMLMAVQRGFVTTLCWSPLAFAIAISTSLVPGASWAAAAVPCLVSSLILAVLGWLIDRIVKTRAIMPPKPHQPPKDAVRIMAPLFALLAILMVCVSGLIWATGLRAVAAAMVFVPVLSLTWIAVQERRPAGRSGAGAWGGMWARGVDYVTGELLSHRTEVVVLTMAGFIGTLGAGLIAPLVAQSGMDLTAIPAWMLLVSLVWLIPVTGQLGMNPILSVSLFAPLLPDPAAIGVSATAYIVAITAGWSLGAASSPYTASTMIASSFGGVSARYLGVIWNGPFTLLGAVLLSVWVATFAGFGASAARMMAVTIPGL